MDTFERAKAAFLQGVQHSEAGRNAEAEACFEASLALWPERSSTLFNLGAMRVRLGQYDAALAVLDRSLVLDAEQADAWCQRGIALAALERSADAVASFERALKLDASCVPALFHLGCTLNELQRHADARVVFERLLQLQPQHAEAWFRHGQTLQLLDRHADALPSYERALALDPANPQAWLNRAGILKDAGRSADATAAYRAALAHGADAEQVQFHLAALQGSSTPQQAPRAYVQELFDDYAARFEQHLVGALNYRGHRVLVEMLQRAAAGRRLQQALDLGCGTGLCGPLLKAFVAQIDGVDLSTQMLAQAHKLGIYRKLVAADITEHLQAGGARYDVVIAADVFTYIGDLGRVFAAVQRVLPAGGLFGLSVEAAPDDTDFRLQGSLRYAHSRRYVERLAQRHGYVLLQSVQQPLREDQRRPIDALYVVLTR
ncbi:MAG: tetratricopeptide repeat protein [Burkholderiaceae bacterium]|nr:tetratricopeptide repeat protein [Burkholderiaceae bacterium]